MTESHLYASQFTYDSWLFSLVLWGFFINILFSALRRYPFKWRHVPFLITHCGLLMIIAGQLVKRQHGLQGVLTIAEGSASSRVILPNSYAVAVISNDDDRSTTLYELPEHKTPFLPLKNLSDNAPEGLRISLLHYAHNVSETMLSWVKGNALTLMGGPPLPFEQDVSTTGFKNQMTLNGQAWNVKAISTGEFASISSSHFQQHVSLNIIDTSSGNIIDSLKLSNFLNQEIVTPYGTLTGKLELAIERSDEAYSALHIFLAHDGKQQSIEIPLSGHKALQNLVRYPSLGQAPLSFDLVATPALLFMHNPKQQTQLFAWTQFGEVFSIPINDSHESPLIAYDDGFLGYTREIDIPICPSRLMQQKLIADELKDLLSEHKDRPLSPPLELLEKSCKLSGVDFAGTACLFLAEWDRHGGWLFSASAPLAEKLQKALKAIDWHSLTESAFKGCFLTTHLFDAIEPRLKCKEDLCHVLKESGYPLLAGTDSVDMTYQKATQHMFAMGAESLWPMREGPITQSLHHSARMLTALFRAYDIHIGAMNGRKVKPLQTIHLESAIKHEHYPGARNRHIENEIPALWLRLEYGKQKDIISIAYDKSAAGLPLSVLQGQFALRFQPIEVEIPHRLRLRQARFIAYPDSAQPYSYEADLWIRSATSPDDLRTTLSMNVVHETSDGYRFYLSNIYPQDPAALKRVQIVVNRDPTKYLLTYPGGALVTLGALLLFGLWPKIRTKKH
jgi:hypothetical protein